MTDTQLLGLKKGTVLHRSLPDGRCVELVLTGDARQIPNKNHGEAWATTRGRGMVTRITANSTDVHLPGDCPPPRQAGEAPDGC